MAQTDNTDNPPLKGVRISVVELARFWNVTPSRIREYCSEGMPVYERGFRGKEHVLSSADCTNWLVDKARKANYAGRPIMKSNDEGKDKITSIKIEKAELELAERRGDLFHFDDYVPLIEDKIVNYRTSMVEIPGEIREEFDDVNRIAQVARAIHQKIVTRLNRFAAALEQIPAETDDAS